MGEHPADFVGGHRPTAAEARRAVGARTMTEAFRLTVEDHPDRVAVRTKDDEVSLTWTQLRDRVDALAGGRRAGRQPRRSRRWSSWSSREAGIPSPGTPSRAPTPTSIPSRTGARSSRRTCSR